MAGDLFPLPYILLKGKIMKRYRIKIRNAKDCRTSITFADLSIKYSNGYSPNLQVKEGEEILLNLCDPEDVHKSFLIGTLRAYIQNGWVEEIPDEQPNLPIIPIDQSQSQFVTEQDIKPTQTEVPPQQILPEVKIVNQVSVSQSEPITDLTKVFSYEDFCKLSHFLKLRFIKENGNIDLLKEISSKTPSMQFRNNVSLRLSNLKV